MPKKQKVTLTILDYVNCHFDGLTDGQVQHIIDKTGIVNPKLYHTVGYQLGHIEAKESYFDEEGFSFLFSADEVINIIERDFKITDIEIIDERPEMNIPDIVIDENFLLEETGRTLREHQINVINTALREHCGIFDASTSSGKTLISLAISKALDPYIKTVVCVPSEQLLNQTHDDYKKSSLKVGKLNASVKPAKREQFIKENNHLIVTNKLFVNCKEYFREDEWAIIQDETHVFGEVTAEVYRFDIPHFPVRIGLTGSFPFKDRLKSRMIKNHIGGDVIGNVQPKELSDKGYISKVDINIVRTIDPEIEELFEEMQKQRPSTYDWSVEQKYLLTNKKRIISIAEYLKTLPDKNTLILCHAEFGNSLAEYMGLPFIDKDTDVNTRQELFGKFNDSDNHLQLASFGTSATGISVDDIFIVGMIDVGKNRTAILQGIGRGMRKSTKQDHVDIVDIYANLKYSKKHKNDRLKIYKEKHYPYKEDKFDIIVKGE